MTLAHDDLPGAAPPLVLLHGWTCNRSVMRPVADAFAAHRCILPDLLGHGRSSKSGDYSIATQARAVLAIAPPGSIIVGHSMGAQVAIEAAYQAPDRVAAVVLLDAAFIAPTDKSRAFGEGLRAQLARVDIAEMIEAFGRNQFVAPPDDPATVEALIAVMRATDPEVTRAAWDAILDWDGRTAFAALTCPILAIAIDKPLNHLADLARLNPRCMTGQVAGSGHMVQFEAMDQVAAMMRRFMTLSFGSAPVREQGGA
jgi:pimeloyl-ACP methyl ester carboxylesterase